MRGISAIREPNLMVAAFALAGIFLVAVRIMSMFMAPSATARARKYVTRQTERFDGFCLKVFQVLILELVSFGVYVPQYVHSGRIISSTLLKPPFDSK